MGALGAAASLDVAVSQRPFSASDVYSEFAFGQ